MAAKIYLVEKFHQGGKAVIEQHREYDPVAGMLVIGGEIRFVTMDQMPEGSPLARMPIGFPIQATDLADAFAKRPAMLEAEIQHRLDAFAAHNLRTKLTKNIPDMPRGR
jgi:hypothetical protein